MATIGNTVLTLTDWAKRLDPKGKVDKIVEMLSQTNEILLDMLVKESNEPMSHRVSVRTGLPTVAWRLMNQGTTPSKSTTAQIQEGIGMMDAWSEVDCDLAKLHGDVGLFRLSEAAAFIEAMNIEAAQTLFYGNTGTAPEEFTGFAPRFSSTTANNGSHILSGAGAGSDNSSVWLVGWGDQTVHAIFPNGSMAGLEHQDLGEVTVQTAIGIGTGRMRAYQDHWVWKIGLVVKDWRYVVRIPNIDISNLVAKSSAADLIELMIKAIHRIPFMSMCKPAFYMNRTCFEMLDIQRRDDVISGGGLNYADVDGRMTPLFRGIPVRKCDALLENEAVVS